MFGGNDLDRRVGSESDCKNCHVIDPVDNSAASYDHVAAADDFTDLANSAIDLDDSSWDSELEVSETQFETSEAGEMSNEDEFDGVLAIRHGLSVAHRTQGCNIREMRGRSGVLAIGRCRSVAPDSCHLQ